MMVTRKRTQKAPASGDTAKGPDTGSIPDITSMEAELEEVRRHEEEIRKRAEGMLEDSRKAVENAVSSYNRLVQVSGTTGPTLAVTEEAGEKTPGKPSVALAPSSADIGKGAAGNDVNDPADARTAGHPHGPADTVRAEQEPLDPDAVVFADKDGVVVDDHTTTDGDDDAGGDPDTAAEEDGESPSAAEDGDGHDADPPAGFEFLG